MERRQAVRALILSNADDSVLLLRMQRPDRPGNFWLLPGGGVKPNEDRLDALRREVREETGLALRGSPRLLWRRVHRFRRGHGEHNRVTEQHEDIYLVRTRPFEPTACNNPDPSEVGIFHEFRWWTVGAMRTAAAADQFAPRALPRLVEGLVADGPPPGPLSLDE